MSDMEEDLGVLLDYCRRHHRHDTLIALGDSVEVSTSSDSIKVATVQDPDIVRDIRHRLNRIGAEWKKKATP